MKVRSDKKFLVNVWVPGISKDMFRSHCFEHHMSMMAVGEIFLNKCLDDYDDKFLHYIISERIGIYDKLDDSYKKLGVRIRNDRWQKSSHFAVYYDRSIAKICSCLFDYCLENFEMKDVWETYGLEFKTKRKKFGRDKLDNRLSDY